MMYIKEILIEEFGAICGSKISLSPEFNLITGENESGKSTVCAFIKYVFYGFTDSKERDRHSSLRTGNSAGSLIIVSDGKTYRIERRESGRIRNVTVYSEDTGEEFTGWKKEAETPGDYFLGVPAALYPRSLYVSQSGGAKLDGGSAEAVSNLLISGDEALNLKQAKRMLDALRKELRLKKGQGGRIFECEQKLAELKERRDRGLSVKKEYEGLMIELKSEEAKIISLTEKLEATKAAVEGILAKKVREQVSRLNEAKKTVKNCDTMTEALNLQYSYEGFLPDKDYAGKLVSISKELHIYRKQCESIRNQIKKIQSELSLVPPKGYEAYCAKGKKDTILSEFSGYQTAQSTANIVLISASLVFFVSLLALFGSLFGLINPSAALIYSALGISFAGTLGALIYRSVPGKRITRLLSELGADGEKDPIQICKKCEEYETKLSASSSYLTETLNEASRALERTENTEKELLSRWNRSSSERALEDCRIFFGKLEELGKKRSNAMNEISVLEAYLSRYGKNEIDRLCALADSTPDVSIDQSVSTDEYISSLEVQLKTASDRKNELSILLAASGANKEDIEALAYEIETEEKRLSEMEENYSALVLALDSLDSAEKNIRRTVSPYLSKHSSTYFSKITDAKYTELKLDGEMNLSYLTAGTESLTDSAYLSGGSADLAWLCLRLALHKRLSSKIKLPLILDEALVYFDEKRLALILKELSEISESGKQIILMSASERELKHLKTASVTKLC